MTVRDQIVALLARVARRAPDRIDDASRLGDLGVGSSIAIGILDARLRESLGSAPVMTWKTSVADLLAHFAATPPSAGVTPIPPAPRTLPPTASGGGGIAGVGLDVEAVAALPDDGDPFYAAHFTASELAHAAETADRREHLAGLWAAKEAARKAVPTLLTVPFTSLEVGHDAAGRPVLRAPAGGMTLHVSISHAAGLATAIVIASR